MRQALEDYCREVDEKAERFAREEVICRQSEHLRAFNFGRMIQRVENSRRDLWLRVGCLLAGLVIGLAWRAAGLARTICTLPSRIDSSPRRVLLSDMRKAFPFGNSGRFRACDPDIDFMSHKLGEVVPIRPK
jgi:hypothetical protein